MAGRPAHQLAAREALRASLLEVTRELLRSRPWSAITMAEIAAGAGVSRQTLYNEFGSRAGFAGAYVLHDADILLSAVEAAIASAAPSPSEAIERALTVFLERIAADPLAINVIAGDDPDGILPMLTTRGGPVVTVATERLAAAIAASWPSAERADILLLAEHVVRLAISFAALPGSSPAETARGAARLLSPFAEQALAAADG